MKNTLTVDSPLGKLCISATDGAVTGLSFGGGGEDDFPCPLLERAALELREYFAGERSEFDLPLAPEGTDFQKKVWLALCGIPFGETRSYGEIAAAVGNPRASRAVGGANNKNPIAILIPCHRVIGADGTLVGYGGGLPIKRALLALEQTNKKSASAGN
ncbi:MAG: methylated-DNA--[protein]-cysteine S-methyltransferase [Oscillospiraceae bacterium]